jgi:serine O-acetyltransferase
MDKPYDRQIENLAEKIVKTYEGDSGINFIDVTNLPVRDKILTILDLLMEVLFPGYTGKKIVTHDDVQAFVRQLLEEVRIDLCRQIELALKHRCRMEECSGCDCRTMAAEVTNELLNELPNVRKMLKGDVHAAFDGDPAAKSFEEVVISYPYITAIAIHRLAHELYLRDIPLIPRIMSERAHEKTGIDIHPGAKIGKNFFIDHGTGVVIGETAVIGDNVKLYQGVTLGAMSFAKDERGQIIKGGKRHPTIEDNVTIYAEATILGDVTIGAGSIIGGNVWLKKSINPGTTVAMAKTESLYRRHSKDK